MKHTDVRNYLEKNGYKVEHHENGLDFTREIGEAVALHHTVETDAFSLTVYVENAQDIPPPLHDDVDDYLDAINRGVEGFFFFRWERRVFLRLSELFLDGCTDSMLGDFFIRADLIYRKYSLGLFAIQQHGLSGEVAAALIMGDFLSGSAELPF